jgi:hypothetical protein
MTDSITRFNDNDADPETASAYSTGDVDPRAVGIYQAREFGAMIDGGIVGQNLSSPEKDAPPRFNRRGRYRRASGIL